MFISKYLSMTLGVTCLVIGATSTFAATSKLTIGTGSVTGVYYPAGGAICRLINKDQKSHHLRCTVEATEGSIYNLQRLQSHKLELAIVQSDAQKAALQGQGLFSETGPNRELRSLFSLYVEPLTLVTRQNAGISSLADLLGKRVDIGNPGSGDRNTMNYLIQAMGWQLSQFAATSELKGAERAQALCDENIDAFVYVVGHPSGTIKEASSSCDISLLPVTGPQVDALLAQHPEYVPTLIPNGLYQGADQDTPSFGVSATVVTTTALSDEAAYYIVKAVFDNFEQFKRLHPAFASLSKEQMVRQGLTASLHPGAERYFREVGLLTTPITGQDK